MATIRCTVVTPEKTELETQARSLIVPLFDGLVGILPGRAPMIGRLGFGLLKITAESGAVTEHFVDGGFVQVTRDGVYILTDRLLKPESLDRQQAESDLAKANALSGVTPEAFSIKERATAQARAKLRLAKA